MLGSLLIWVKLARRFFHPIKPIVAVQFLGYDAKVTFESEAHKRVLNSDGIELSTLPELRKAHEDFYSLLFAEESVNLETQNHLLSFFSRRLSDHDRDVCEGALLPDITQAQATAGELYRNLISSKCSSLNLHSSLSFDHPLVRLCRKPLSNNRLMNSKR